MADTTVETSPQIAQATAAGRTPVKTPGLAQRINDRIAISITNVVGTMWCAYAFSVMVMIPLYYPAALNIVQFVSSAFLQLVLLPLIMVGQNVLSRASESRAKKDHKMLIDEHRLLKEELAEIKALVKSLGAIEQKLGVNPT